MRQTHESRSAGEAMSLLVTLTAFVVAQMMSPAQRTHTTCGTSNPRSPARVMEIDSSTPVRNKPPCDSETHQHCDVVLLFPEDAQGDVS